MKGTEKNLTAQNFRFGIVVSTFNEFVTSRLLAAATEVLKQEGASDHDIKVVRVPGAFEIPLVARKLAYSRQFDAVICLGAVIHGETSHFDYICTETAHGIAQASLDTGIPVLFGVLTTHTAEQALARAGDADRNRGADVARTAIEMANLMKELENTSKMPTGFRHPDLEESTGS